MAQSSETSQVVSGGHVHDSIPHIRADRLLTKKLEVPCSRMLIAEDSEGRHFVIIGKHDGELHFFTTNGRFLELTNEFDSEVTAICPAKLRGNDVEIMATSIRGQVRLYTLPAITYDDREGLARPVRHLSQYLEPSIDGAHVADINGDGVDELVVFSASGCHSVKIYHYADGSMVLLRAYSTPDYIAGISLGLTSSVQRYALLRQLPPHERDVLRFCFASGQSLTLPKAFPEGQQQFLLVPEKLMFLNVFGYYTNKMLVINSETEAVTIVQCPQLQGNFVSATSVTLLNGTKLLVIASSKSTLLIYRWTDSSPSSQVPIAIVKVAEIAERISVIPGKTENEIIVGLFTHLFDVLIYRINLQSVLGTATQ